MKTQIKQIRTKLGLKQKEAASRAGIELRRYGSYERGERSLSLEVACSIADAFDCSLDELAGRWEYVGRFTDERQRRMNQAYGSLDESQKSMAASAVEGMASEAAQEKTTLPRPVPIADTA